MRVRVLDSWAHFTPVGIRFWDPVLDGPVTDGLLVTARPAQGDARRAMAVQNGNGLYTLMNLPGLRGREAATEGDVTTRPFILEVADRRGRFLPVSLATVLPPPTADGLLLGGDGTLDGFVLFGAPTRPLTPGLGVVEGQLWDTEGDRPAAYAILTAQLPGGVSRRGMTDERGCFRLLVPYPSVVDAGTLPGTPLGQLSWPVTLKVYSKPAILAPNPGNPLPDWSAILNQLAEPEADLYPNGGSPVSSITTALPYGRPLTLRTLGDPKSRMLIRSH